MSDTVAALAWCPFPDREGARKLAGILLEERLIACANILPRIESVFEWEGEVSGCQEVAVLFKTTAELLEPLVVRLGECHPYDTPAIVAWSCDTAHALTLDWLQETLGDGPTFI